MKASIKNFLNQTKKSTYNYYFRDSSNIDIVLSQILPQINDCQQLSFPSAGVDLLRDCMEEKVYNIRTVKKQLDLKFKSKTYVKRFSTLIDILTKNRAVPIKFEAAKKIMMIADSYRSISDVYQQSDWVGDVHNHFHNASSFGYKGRVLNSIIRIMRCEKCLELGTAYGMSALFILEALNSIGSGHLTTIEGLEFQFTLASKLLNNNYGNRVSCHLGMTQEILPELVKSIGKIDFMFHDAAHTEEHYIRDFTNVLPILLPGSVIVFDDIRWNNKKFTTKNPRCYRGWMKIIAHPRVIWAIEIDKKIGIALLK